MLIILINIFNLLVNFVIGLIIASFLGPDSFGRFAVAIGAGGLIQVALFGWLRLSAARFYSESARTARPELRSSLDRALWTLAFGVTLAGLACAAIAQRFDAAPALVFWALAFAAANGAFEYRLALLRARFHDKGYAGLILVKNALSLALTAGLAWTTGSAGLTLAGTTLSLGLSALLLGRVLRDPAAAQTRPRASVLREGLAYGLPLSASLLLFALIPLANRALGAQAAGFAEAGQLSLAQDIGLRLVLTIGYAMDQLLFQLAVRADEHHGESHGRAQVAQNMAIMAAILLPALAGVWLVLPSFEALIVPADYRGAFSNALTLLLPGLAAYGLMTFALAPAFQIARRTWPVIAAAGVACVADALLLILPPRDWSLDRLALAQTGALIAGFLALLALSPLAKPHWPRWRDTIGILAATLAMIGAVAPLRAMTPGVGALLTQALAGALVYGAIALAFDIAGVRGALLSRQKKRAAAGRP
ncbi:MAG: Membrane protein involved in the export of O-antigen and teichoic acid [Hyphomicrobiales bacterium]|nr:Membrane protein involved in the export of O-antigen and teichoic acid [Hyphomicrobiales bacterium]